MNYRHIYMLIIEHAKSEEKLGLRERKKMALIMRGIIFCQNLYFLYGLKEKAI